MESISEYLVSLKLVIVTIVCVIITFYFIMRKYLQQDALEVFNYLNIQVVSTEETSDEVIAELRRRCSKHRALGFDCEWITENGRRQPVALVQLSSLDGFCGLFRLCCIKNMPESLKNLLEDAEIYKVGVAPEDDARYLSQNYSVDLNSTLDMRHLAVACGYEGGGLATLSKDLLGVILDKSWEVRCSNWEAEILTQQQLQYAAMDAHVAIRIFQKLVNKYYRYGIFSWFHKENDVWNDLDNLFDKYADLPFTQAVKGLKEGNHNKETRTVYKKPYPNATRSKPLYHNCFLQAPDGELLCTCEDKKAMWYVEKELGDVITEDPLTVRLRFEPSGRSVGDVGKYYQMTKENKCVVCGATKPYIRKNVVPREYRKYFPEIMKDHSSHDVLLLCTQCHQRSNIRDQRIREKLARVCSAPLASQACPKYIEDQVCKRIRSAARALLYQSCKHNLPEARKAVLEDILLQYYTEHDEITQELLKEAVELDVVIPNLDYETHGLKVVEYFLMRPGGLLRLEELWREHFVTTMKPKYLPELWSVKHNEERLKVKWTEGRLTEAELKSIGIKTF